MRGGEGLEPRAVDPHPAATALEAPAQGAQAGNRRSDILTLGKPVDPALALGQDRQHQGPMRDRLVAREVDGAGNVSGWLDCLHLADVSAQHGRLRQTIP